MQILYVGNGNYKHRGSWYYDVGRKIVNGLIRNGHNVYFFSDRDTARAAALFNAKPLGVRACNRAFIETCANFTPDFIVLSHADIIHPRSLVEIRRLLPHVKIAQVNVDAIFNHHNQTMIHNKLPYVDATFITTAGPALKQFYTSHGLVSFIPNPVDKSIEWPQCHEHKDQPHDVFWAMRGRHSFPNDPRFTLPLYLEKSGRLTISYHGMNGRPELSSAHYYKTIAQARMGLNISSVRTRGYTPHASSEELYLYASDRISHYLGSGLLVLTTRNNQLEHLFVENKELVFFETSEELLEKVLYFKDHEAERQAIAYAGWQKVHTHFNEQRVAHYIVEATLRRDNPHDYAWPTEKY